MKPIALALLTLLTKNVFSQVYKETFLGEDYEKYKGLLFKFNPKFNGELNYMFYTNSSEASKMYSGSVLYPDKRYSFMTVKDSLKNKIFKLVDIASGNDYKTKIFMLRDTSNMGFVYYKYNIEHELSFPFLVSGFKITSEDLQNEIHRGVDEMTNEIEISTPITRKARVIKLINKGVAKTYLRLSTKETDLEVGGKGIIVLFTDGTKWNHPSQNIEVSSTNDGWLYSAFFNLTPADISLFTKKKIARFRLYIYNDWVNEVDSEKLRLSLIKISKMK